MTGILGGLIGSFKSGLRWSGGSMGVAITHTAAAYAPLNNGQFFGFGAATGGITTATASYNYSINGTSWATGTLPASIQGRAAAGNNTRVIVASNTTTNYYSSNGTTWTAGGSMSDAIKTEGLWNGSRFVFTSQTAANGIIHSTDGTTWTSVSNIGANSLAFNGNTYIVVPSLSSSTGRINTTNFTEAGNWSNITLPTTATWTSIRFANGIWVAAINGSTTYATSTNGTTWTSRTLPAALAGSGTAIRPKMAVFKEKFYYLAYVSSTVNIYSSADGINWTLESNSTLVQLPIAQGWAVGPTSLIAVGTNSSSSGSAIYVRGEE